MADTTVLEIVDYGESVGFTLLSLLYGTAMGVTYGRSIRLAKQLPNSGLQRKVRLEGFICPFNVFYGWARKYNGLSGSFVQIRKDSKSHSSLHYTHRCLNIHYSQTRTTTLVMLLHSP
ncbi:hypothetical protein BJ085DRAFT_32012 [Dimargaris cristalligena]|uniref:Uncharacterized protein n=1 Tax=Dimargaris cristalligena TaxID=215637 RepID=A0A4P9ZME6_9FUNG|nr:hypothetical protein BJ085DRAFT_32012 [Dimargaris cristalligena]|eukprot:RKP34546.1 hypothetical protein BJ085DRAFT_32012 [Dimargaris cristalligena]